MKIAIIGGGLTGLTAAYELTQAHHQVTIFEDASHLGGLAAGFTERGWDWSLENYYHHWFTSDRTIKQLVKAIGTQRKFVINNPKTVVFYRGSFYPLDTPVAILKFPGLNLVEKARFAVVTAYLKYLASWRPLETVTAGDWLTKAYGGKIYRLIWAPLLQGKFGQYAPVVNMAWMWARLKSRTPRLMTYRGGFQAFINDLSRSLFKSGVILKTSNRVTRITRSKAGSFTVLVGTQAYHFDRCLVTVSPQLTRQLVPSLPRSYIERLATLKSLGALTLILALRKPLSPQGYYWYNLPKVADFPFLSLVEHTNFVSKNHFGGDYLVYCGDYREPDDPILRSPKAAIVASFLPALKLINPRFSPGWVKKSWVFKTTYAQPVPFLNHSLHLPPLRTPVNGLYYAGMSHIYPWDRGTNYAAALGQKVAQLMLKDNSINGSV